MHKTLYSREGQLIAQAIIDMRTKADLTQRDLAERLGRHHSVVAAIELGQRRVDLAEFYAICRACEVSPSRTASGLMKAFEAE